MATVYQERAVDATVVTAGGSSELRHTTTTTSSATRQYVNQQPQQHEQFSDDGIDDEVVAAESGTNAPSVLIKRDSSSQQRFNNNNNSDAESVGSRSSARRRSKREAVKEKREQRKYDDKEKKARDKAEKEERKRAKKSAPTTSTAGVVVPRSIEHEAESVVRTRIPDDNIDYDDNSDERSGGATGNIQRRLVPPLSSNNNNIAAPYNINDNADAYYRNNSQQQQQSAADHTIYSSGTLGSRASYRLDDTSLNSSNQQFNDTLHSRGSYAMTNKGNATGAVMMAPQHRSSQQQQQLRSNGSNNNFYNDGGASGDMPIPVQIERTTQQTTTTTTGGGGNNFVPLTGSATIARMGGPQTGGMGGSHLLVAPSSMTATPEPTAGAGTLKRQPNKPVPKGQLAIATVALLSDEDQTYECDKRWNGDALFDMVCASLNLEEREYFGLRYKDRDDQVPVWLDLEKPIKRQMQKHAVSDDKWEFEFACKYYPPEPNQLQDDLTRYLLCLQVRSDIIEEKLPCSFVTYAVLGSYLVQSEIGDYNIHHTPSGEYVAEFAIAPSYVQTPELLAKVAELHKQHRGMTPAEADMHYLDQAKRLAFYGVDLHRAEDSDKQQVFLGVNAYGLSVYKEKLRISRFPWPKILKIAYRRNQFHVKLRQGDFEQADTSLVYKCLSERATKRLWKVCVDFHTFFRLRMAEDAKNAPFKFPRFGTSKYRFKSRPGPWDGNNSSTMNNNNKLRADTLDRMPPSFERSWSRRTGTTSRSVDAAGMLIMNDAGTDGRRLRSISVQGDGPEYKDAGVGGDAGIDDVNGDLQRKEYQKIGFSYMDPESLKNARLSQYRGGAGGGVNGNNGGLDGFEREYDVAAGAGENPYGYNQQQQGGMYGERTTRMKQTTSTTKSTLIHSLEPGGNGYNNGQYNGENGTEPLIREKVTVMSRVVPPAGAGQPLVTTNSHTYGAESGVGGNRSLLNGGADTPLSVETVSSKIRTVETTTYTTDVDGKREMHTTEKVTIMTDGEPIDHDRALAEAILEATGLNPAMKVVKIEIEEPDND